VLKFVRCPKIKICDNQQFKNSSDPTFQDVDMNFRIVMRILGFVSLFLGVAMVFSIPWAFGYQGMIWEHERRGVNGLILSIGISFLLGIFFLFIGRKAKIQLFRKEAVAVVALSWILATILGALPYVLSQTERATNVRMNVFDAMFESQSGFSTTGATVLSNVENREMLPRCILFWRASTHFLGGLGIIVLLVAILGQGTVSKSIFRVERASSPGSTLTQSKPQHLSWTLFFIYFFLNVLLTILLALEGIPFFDALCHAFSTLATGGFSTFNASAGYFITNPNLNGALIEWTLIIFMFLGGTNFLLFYWCLRGKPGKLLRDTEWRTYLAIIIIATIIITLTGHLHNDFSYYGTSDKPIVLNHNVTEMPSRDATAPLSHGFRTSCFQVVSMMTTTGFCTNEFEKWNAAAMGILLLIMVVGACSGSTSGGMKVIRWVLNYKIIVNEVERSYRPNVVRSIWLQKETIDRDILVSIIVFSLIYITIIGLGTAVLTVIEPDATWIKAGFSSENKLTDSFSAIVSTISNVGPGTGMIGARQHFGVFTPLSKFFLTWVMMIGRLEIFAVLVIFSPSFWRSH